jgi:hypothetical protein
MHEPRPHGVFVYGGSLTDEDAAALELMSRRLTNLRGISGLPSMKMVRTLPDGSMAIVQDAGGVFRAFVVKELPAPPVQFDGLAKAYVPMLFSGVITEAVVRGSAGVGMKLSRQTRRRISGYKADSLPSEDQQLQRFVIDYNPLVQELAPQTETSAKFTQYAAQRPTWYSGAMAEVMQIVGGYGRQDIESLPKSPVERVRMQIPAEVWKKIESEISGLRLPGYTGLPPKTGQYQFDYKFHNTHGVAFDSDGSPWLIRISASGVFAIPMPIIPATATKAFREFVEKNDDTELLAILDRFGAMPSGEAFPSQPGAFEAWRRAGVIIKVCDVADFYSHISYSSACGWSLNSSGTEGINTCYDYDEDQGIGLGLTYKLKLKLSPAKEAGRIRKTIGTDNEDDLAKIKTYLGAVFRKTGDPSPKSLAIRYKLARADEKDILSRSSNLKNGEVLDSEIDYWANLETQPISAHTGNVTQTAKGYLLHTAKKGPQIKFPEPYMGGCVSHDFLPLINGRGKSVNCDTIMFGYYVGDQLKVVKYFYDPRAYAQDVEDDYEECMIVGSWQRIVTKTPVGLMGNFYTSDFDEREAGATSVEVTNIEGKDMGYDSQPFFGFDAPFWKPGTLWRNRYFTTKVKTKSTEGRNTALAVCIPFLCRNALLHAKKKTTTGGKTTESMSLSSVTDPYSYRFWTYDFVMHWAGGLSVMKGSPYPKKGNPVWVEIEEYGPGLCSDFADQGPWIPALPADYTWLVHPNANEWKLSGGGGPPKVSAYSRSTQDPSTEVDRLDVDLMDQPQYVNKSPSIMYFLPSPDDAVGIFYRDAAKVLFGKATYGNVSEPGDDTGTDRKRYGFCRLADNKSAHHFIGVIDE